jgi:hypothetical protein
LRPSGTLQARARELVDNAFGILAAIGERITLKQLPEVVTRDANADVPFPNYILVMFGLLGGSRENT